LELISEEFEPVMIDSNLYVITGGNNSTLILGKDKAVLVDTKFGGELDNFKKLVLSLIGKRQLIVLNTHMHLDNVGGNIIFREYPIIAGNYTLDYWRARNSKGSEPTNFLTSDTIIDLGSEELYIRLFDNCHTKSDLVIELRKRKILILGDIATNNYHPTLMKEFDSNAENLIRCLEFLNTQFKGYKLFIPSKGKATRENIVEKMLKYMKYAVSIKQNANALQELEKYFPMQSWNNQSSAEKTLKFLNSR
jgi:glyoxylase-like metal-dependent hydrolase (beta-lactamase superfamily II)